MQLSHYLDVVEVELVKQVGTRSDSFFEALTNIQVFVAFMLLYLNYSFIPFLPLHLLAPEITIGSSRRSQDRMRPNRNHPQIHPTNRWRGSSTSPTNRRMAKTTEKHVTCI